MHDGSSLGLMILRWLHFMFGITWIGLLYYFNFGQGAFFAEADAATKSAATQKLVPRALWWFRWGAMGTFVVGLLILLNNWMLLGSGFVSSSYGVSILTGSILGPDGTPAPFKEGKIDGATITFAQSIDAGGMPLELAYKGIVSATEIKFTLEVFGMPLEFVAKKAQ